jgi:hypothetical protein
MKEMTSQPSATDVKTATMVVAQKVPKAGGGRGQLIFGEAFSPLTRVHIVQISVLT